MMLIADSGSTNTTWVLIDREKTLQTIQTGGLNPYFYSEKHISNEIRSHLRPQISGDPDEIFFYGSGCKAEENRSRMNRLILELFPESRVHVDHDLMGAAHSLSKDQPGIICILGTGSNSCLYDGTSILENKTSLGYVLGDEGSGAVMGIELIRALLYQSMPKELEEAFHEAYSLEPMDILKRVYMEPFPNQYLAQFTRFIHEHKDHEFLRRLIFANLEAFVQRNIIEYDRPDLRAHFLGSISFYFQDELMEILQKSGIEVGTIAQDAIPGLLEYHRRILGDST